MDTGMALNRNRSRKPSKHVTLSAEILAQLEQEAADAKVGVSEVIESHIKTAWAQREREPTISEVRLEQLTKDVGELRARVLPLVAKVWVLLEQIEAMDATGPGRQEPAGGSVKIATYEQMYRGEQQGIEGVTGETTESVSEPSTRRWWKR
jgi:hypothetical protein